MPKDDRWSNKQKGEKTSQELMGWAWVFATLKGKIKEGSEIWMKAKIWKGVSNSTTLGDTLVEYQLLCFGSFIVQGLGLFVNIDSLCGSLWLPIGLMGPDLGLVIIIQANPYTTRHFSINPWSTDWCLTRSSMGGCMNQVFTPIDGSDVIIYHKPSFA